MPVQDKCDAAGDDKDVIRLRSLVLTEKIRTQCKYLFGGGIDPNDLQRVIEGYFRESPYPNK